MKIRQLCDKHKILLIIDEVQTGLGWTGRLLCQEYYNIRADMVILGKALSGGFFPVSAVLGTSECFKSIVPGTHGSTFGGNPLACVAAMESVKVVLDEKLSENSFEMGSILISNLQKCLKNSKYVTDIRGKGLFIGIDLDPKVGPNAKEIAYKSAELGFLIKNPKDTKIRIAPALTIGIDEVNFITETLLKILTQYK